MKMNIALLLGATAIALAYTIWSDKGQAPVMTKPMSVESGLTQTSIAAPDFKVTGLDGKTYSLSQFKGKAVVLNFWATWCAPCVIEFPQMLDLASANEDSTVFLFISQDDTDDVIKTFANKYGKSLPQKNVIIGRDANKDIARNLYQTHKLPETYLIDPQGMIREKIIGAIPDWSGPDAQKKIDILF
jgi:thiol-disulfide isomerase/thioredoxin